MTATRETPEPPGPAPASAPGSASPPPRPPHLLLTGPPGIGKTTVTECLVARLRARGCAVAGFYTEEVRGGARRLGFRIVALGGDGATAMLAHVQQHGGGARIGRYRVDVRGFEALALPELERPCDILVIDEIGKMECLSSRFVAAVERLLDGTMPPLVATIAARGGGLIERAKAHAAVELVHVTRANRDTLPVLLAARC